MKLTKSIYINSVFATFLAVITLSSCTRDAQSPGYEYMPDMYRSPAIEAYVDYGEIRDTLHPELNQTISTRKPVEGTVPLTDIAMNDMPYNIPNTTEGYELAGEILKSPYPQSEEIIAQGMELYIDFCLQCHGASGQGDGPVITVGGHPAPQAYDAGLKDLPEGKMFHSITYGKGLMGAHASQLTKSQRWKIVAYIKTLQGNDTAEADTTEATEMSN